MADQASKDEKTEQPTAKRLEQAVEKGNVAKSRELSSVTVLFAGMLAFKFTSDRFGEIIQGFMRHTYHESSFMSITVSSFPNQAFDLMKLFLSLTGPILLIVFLFALGANYAQVGVIFAKKAIIPDFKKINPFKGIKKLFSSQSLVELGKGILKLLILGLVSYQVLSSHSQEYFLLTTMTVSQIFSFIGSVFYELTIKAGIALLIMAIADYAYQKWKHLQDLKMTKQEVKDERKQQEGDPKLKSKIKSKQLQMAAQRLTQVVPEATAVVTNPTTYAVAIQYQPHDKSDAPKVTAKGKLKIAEKIKEIAHKHNIPVIEDKPLARGLYDACEAGMEIPYAFYQAVAELLSKIYAQDKSNLPELGDINE
jgi:flagellar biosynthetic protein FlhB